MSNLTWFKYEWVWEKSRGNGFFDVKYRPLKFHENILVFSAGGVATGSITPVLYNPQGVESCPPTKRSKKGLSSTVRTVTEAKGMQTKTNWPRSVLRFSSEWETSHPTQKPVALMEYLIRTYTNEGELVLDNTCGSGTTLVAAIRTGRRAIGIDTDAGYCDIARKRIAEEEQRYPLLQAIEED